MQQKKQRKPWKVKIAKEAKGTQREPKEGQIMRPTSVL